MHKARILSTVLVLSPKGDILLDRNKVCLNDYKYQNGYRQSKAVDERTLGVMDMQMKNPIPSFLFLVSILFVSRSPEYFSFLSENGLDSLGSWLTCHLLQRKDVFKPVRGLILACANLPYCFKCSLNCLAMKGKLAYISSYPGLWWCRKGNYNSEEVGNTQHLDSG